MSNHQIFEDRVLPHLDAAYNLARWLLRRNDVAEEAVQEACFRALKYLDSLRTEDDARPWLLGIVRNTCFTLLQRERKGPDFVEFDEELFDAATHEDRRSPADPASQLEQQRARIRVDAAIQALSPPLREVIVLREIEDLEYSQIASIAGVPIGTVMSRLSRAREKLRGVLMTSSLE